MTKSDDMEMQHIWLQSQSVDNILHPHPLNIVKAIATVVPAVVVRNHITHPAAVSMVGENLINELVKMLSLSEQ